VTPEELKNLEQALSEARASLQTEQEQGAGTKTAPQDTPQDNTQAQTTDLLAALRQQIAEEVKQAIGTKSEQAQQRVDVAALVKEALQETLKEQQAAEQVGSTGTNIKAIVQEVLAEYKSPRKTPLSQPENEDEQGRGSKGGGTYIPKQHLGEKDNFNTFLCAAGRKDRAAIHDIQKAHNVVGYGGKALVEGTGASFGVAA
jgi:hypothetical protein